jgi:hypothetical protein
MSAHALFSGDPTRLAERISPLLRLEIASIGAISATTNREKDPGYAYFLREAKIGKQANAEQMNTLLRLAGRPQVESGGLTEPVLRLQTLALQKTNTTAMLQAMRLVEEMLVARYLELTKELDGFELRAMTTVRDRATKHWMLLVAHVAQRKDGDSSHAALLPLPLSSYFATDADRVCMRCLLDRPGTRTCAPPATMKSPASFRPTSSRTSKRHRKRSATIASAQRRWFASSAETRAWLARLNRSAEARNCLSSASELSASARRA